MRGMAFTIAGSALLVGCTGMLGDDAGSTETRELSVLKGEVQRLNREIEWLHQQVTTQQNRLDVGAAPPLEQAYNPLRFQGLERKVCSMEQLLESLGRDLKSLHGSSQETAIALRRLQQDHVGNLERKVADLSKMKADVHHLVKALDGDSASTAGVESCSVRVKAGDTLEKIARQQGCTVDAIRRLNRLKGDRIQVGQQLQLP
jgi:hypothetical protein